MADKVRLGVLGLGRIGKMHIRNIMQIGGYEILQGVDPYLTPELETEILDMGVQACSKDAEDVFGNPEIDAVLICSITTTHADYIIRSAKAKKAIFCEKPIDNDIVRIREALQVVEEEGVTLQLGFVRRFDRHHGAIAQGVREHRIGNPEMLHITSRDPELCSFEYLATSGGLFVDMMIHDFDMARFIMGSEVKEVSAIGAALVNPKVAEVGDIDSAIVTLRFENGAIGTISCSRRSGFGYDQRIEILGSDGFLIDANDFPNNVKFYNNAGCVSSCVMDGFISRYKDAFFNEMIEFKQSILEQRQPLVTGLDGLKAVLIAEAANRSLASGQFEAVEKN